VFQKRLRFLRHIQKHGKHAGKAIREKDYGPVDIIKIDEDYLLKIKDHTINLLHFNDKRQAIMYARRKIKEEYQDETIRGEYIRKIDGKIHNFVPESFFKKSWIKGGRE